MVKKAIVRSLKKSGKTAASSLVVNNGTAKKEKAAIYSRTSSSANIQSDTHRRQLRASLNALERSGCKKLSLKKVTECISGMLPLRQRKTLMDLMSGSYSHIFVESIRALARKSSAIEELHQAAKKHGTRIIVADAGPELFNHNASPAQNFQRRVLAAVTEFERDVIVDRLASGLQRKREMLQKATGKTKVKVNGRKSYFEHALAKLGNDETKKKKLKKQIAALCISHKAGRLSLRNLAVKASKFLQLQKPMGKDAAVTLSQNVGVH